MKRILVFGLLISLGQTSLALAGESLVTSGARHAQQLVASQSATPQPPAVGQKPAPALQSQVGTLAKSGVGKKTKAMLFIGLAVGFAASVYTIDHHVLDVTPSSLGTRQD